MPTEPEIIDSPLNEQRLEGFVEIIDMPGCYYKAPCTESDNISPYQPET